LLASCAIATIPVPQSSVNEISALATNRLNKKKKEAYPNGEVVHADLRSNPL
jgi:hypothetical protein